MADLFGTFVSLSSLLVSRSTSSKVGVRQDGLRSINAEPAGASATQALSANRDETSAGPPPTVVDADEIRFSPRSISALRSARSQMEDGVGNAAEPGEPPRLSSSDIDALLNDVLSGLDGDTAERVERQLDVVVEGSGLRDFLDGATSRTGSEGMNGSVVADGQVISGSTDPLNSLGTQIQAYLALIAQLDGDAERLNSFLNSVDASFESGARDFSQALAEFAETGQAAEVEGVSVQSAQSMTVVSFESMEIDLQMRVSADGNVTFERASEQINLGDPLVFDLDGDGIEVSTLGDGVVFDIDGDGYEEQTAFATGDDAFLALDRNENGTIDSGRELFGDQNGARNGLDELAKFDDNGDGVIDKQDSVYSQLLLFSDRNRDGRSQDAELQSLRESEIESIDLRQKDVAMQLASGNHVTQIASYTRHSGEAGLAGDVMLRYLA